MISVIINVKIATGSKVAVEVSPDDSVAKLKGLLAAEELANTPSDQQRLIFKGKILKDDQTLASYGIAADDTLHLVKSKSAQERQGTSGNVQEAAREAPQPGLIPSWMADSPFFRQMLDNPEVFRDMVMNNPAIQPILERNPELRAALNDTDRLRDLLRAQSNPALMREHMRNADRALNNIESLPGGFEALRRFYEDSAGPMMDALEGNPLAAPAEGRRDAHAAQDRGQGTTAAGGGQGSAPDDAPLPNPWGPAGGEAAGGDGPGGQGMLGSNPFAALLGGGAPGGLPDLGNASGETTDRDAFLREFSNGMMMDHDARQMLQTVVSNPALMDMIVAENPALRQLIDATPGMRQLMADPQFIRQSLDMMSTFLPLMQGMSRPRPGGGAGGNAPNPMQGFSQDALRRLFALGGGSGPLGNAQATAGLGAGGAGAADAGALQAMMRTLTEGMQGAPPPPVADPEAAYATQLQQLQDMGFIDRQANIRALQATGGNVSLAIEQLLSQL